jgi:hypothetical protein
MASPARYVHVIMPIGSDPCWPSKQVAISRSVENFGLTPHFPNYLPFEVGFDLRQLMGEIRGATAVIVDLSHERPSCYYELALAEAAAIPVIAVAETGTPIHQAVARSMVGFYESMDQLCRLVEVGLSEVVPSAMASLTVPQPAS